jgi:hypothetical protein
MGRHPHSEWIAKDGLVETTAANPQTDGKA